MTDIKHAARALLHARAFTAIVVVTLGLGIGATTAIVSVVDALLLSPLPYQDAERLVILFQRSPGANVDEDSLSPPQFRDVSEQSTVFEGLAMMAASPLLLTREGPAEHANQLWTSSSFLHMLGAKPHLGRLLSEADDQPGAPLVVILTYELWQRRYGSDPEIVGESIGVEHIELEVVGVLEPGFLLDAEVFSNNFTVGKFDLVTSLPLTEEQAADRTRESYRVVGKLRPGVSEMEAQAELDVIAARMLVETPPTIHDASFTIDAVPLLDQVVGRVRTGLWLLLAAALALLLIASMNVANLMLARAASQQTELGIRAALGAGRHRLVARALTESLLLAGVGAVLGVVLAAFLTTILGRLGPVNLPRLDTIQIDGRTLLAGILLALIASVFASIAPAWRFANIDPKIVVTDASPFQRVLRKRVDGRSILVVIQVSLAFVLLVGAGLVSRSFVALLEAEPGFRAEGTLSLRLSERFDNNRRPETLFASVRELPGVISVAIGSPLPFAPGAWWAPIRVEGYEPVPGGPALIADRRTVSPDYFDVMGIPLLAGRSFDQQDLQPGAPPVRIVDRLVVDQFWPDGDPIGKRIYQTERGRDADEPPLATVVGVVEHVRHSTLEGDGRMTMYLPAFEIDRTYLLVRTDGDPNLMVNPVTNVVRNLDPNIALSDIRTMTGRISDAMAPRRLSMVLIHAFGWLALLLAAIGLLGLVAYDVSQGVPEIGMRMTLGATRRNILRLVLTHAASVIALGLLLGAVGARMASSLVSSLLYATGASDISTYVAVVIVLVIVTLAACWIPAHRATRLNPVDAIRKH